MPYQMKRNAFVVLGLSVLFALFFNITKHFPALSAVNPFADDPYDAIGTFALQAGGFLALLSLFRAFRPYRNAPPSAEQTLLLARTQLTIVLAVIVALVGNLVALMRHTSVWLGTPAGSLLAALVVGFVLLSALIGRFVLVSAHQTMGQPQPGAWKRPLIISLIFFIVLLGYPEQVRETTIGALLTVVIGAVLLFMGVWAWGTFLSSDTRTVGTAGRPRWHWGLVVVVGMLLGLTIVFRELSEGGGTIDLAGSSFIIAIYIGLEVAGIVIGYAFLSKFLRLFRQQHSASTR